MQLQTKQTKQSMKRIEPTAFLPAAVASHLERERRINRLPVDVLNYVLELSVSREEEVAPLAHVSSHIARCSGLMVAVAASRPP